MLMNNEKVRSSKTAGLLAFFLGSFGVHNFYLGEKKKGFAHIGIAVVEIGLIIAWVVLKMTTLQEIDNASIKQLMTMGDKVASVSATLDALRLAASLVGLANEIWAIVELIQIANEGEAGIVRRGFKSATPAAATAPAPAQPETPEQQPPVNPGIITG